MSVPITSRPEQSLNFALFFFAYYGYIGVFSPYASLYFADSGLSAAQIGVLMSLMQVMRIFGPNLWGWVADHTSRRVLVLRATSAAAALTFCGMFWGQTFRFFFVLLVVLNLFTSAQGPLSEALMLSAMRGDLTHYGRLRLWGSVGFIVLVTVSGQLLDWQGVGMTPWISLAMLAMVAGVALNLREEPIAHAHHEAPSVRKLLQRREVVAFFASTFLMVAAHASLYVYYSLYLAGIGYSKTVIGLMWALSVVVEIAWFLTQARWLPRWHLHGWLMLCSGLMLLRMALTAGAADKLWVLVLAQALHAFTFAAHHTASVAMVSHHFPGRLRGRGQALYTVIAYGFPGVLGGLLGGLISERFGLAAVFWASVLTSVLAMLASWKVWRHHHPASHEDRERHTA